MIQTQVAIKKHPATSLLLLAFVCYAIDCNFFAYFWFYHINTLSIVDLYSGLIL